jgi:diguanylate cyclase
MMPAADLDHTRSIAARAVEAMASLSVPPTPRNFEIWYAHFAGASPELSRAIQDVVNRQTGFDADVSEALYAKHLSPAASVSVVDDMSRKFESELTAMLSNIAKAGQDTKSYGMALDVVSGEMARGVDQAALNVIVGKVAAATRAMQARTATLEAQLAAASDEVKTMKASIEAVRAEARTDPLTGLANRKMFDEKLAAAIAELPPGGDLCLIMGDIDHFKKFNDTWGHQTGDQVLRLVASGLSENVKGRDTAARYGGEEFAVVLPNTSIPNGRIVAEQIRQTVESKKVVKKSTGETLGVITMSLGIARYIAGEGADELIKRADACLYAAKRNGRNQVVTEKQVNTSEMGAEALAARAAKAKAA